MRLKRYLTIRVLLQTLCTSMQCHVRGAYLLPPNWSWTLANLPDMRPSIITVCGRILSSELTYSRSDEPPLERSFRGMYGAANSWNSVWVLGEEGLWHNL